MRQGHICSTQLFGCKSARFQHEASIRPLVEDTFSLLRIMFIFLYSWLNEKSTFEIFSTQSNGFLWEIFEKDETPPIPLRREIPWTQASWCVPRAAANPLRPVDFPWLGELPVEPGQQQLCGFHTSLGGRPAVWMESLFFLPARLPSQTFEMTFWVFEKF